MKKSTSVEYKESKSRADEAYNILKETLLNRSANVRDESTIYGEHVAAKHRKYSAHTRSVVEHIIGNILFKADMGKFDPKITHQANNQQEYTIIFNEPNTTYNDTQTNDQQPILSLNPTIAHVSTEEGPNTPLMTYINSFQ